MQVGYQRRFDAGFVEAKRIVDEGGIGQPLIVLATSRDIEWPEGELPRDTGGFLLDMASHDYDAVCWFLGGKPVEVSALRQARDYLSGVTSQLRDDLGPEFEDLREPRWS